MLLRLKVVENNIWWDTGAEHRALSEWFIPELQLEFDIEATSFDEIPFSEYRPGFTGVDLDWYDENVSPRGVGFDMVMFAVNADQWESERARGWRTNRTLGPVELQFQANRVSRLYSVAGRDLGSTYFNYARHEILHGLFYLTCGERVESGRPGSGCIDTTHFWWERGNLRRALKDWSRENDKARLRRFLRSFGSEPSYQQHRA